MTMCSCASIVFSTFHGCGMKLSLERIVGANPPLGQAEPAVNRPAAAVGRTPMFGLEAARPFAAA